MNFKTSPPKSDNSTSSINLNIKGLTVFRGIGTRLKESLYIFKWKQCFCLLSASIKDVATVLPAYRIW